jgi:hypothetical protein
MSAASCARRARLRAKWWNTALAFRYQGRGMVRAILHTAQSYDGVRILIQGGRS